MSWNYRLTRERVRQFNSSEEEVFAIREVYYDKTGKVNGWTAEPVYPCGETWKEFQESFAMYQRASLVYDKKEKAIVTDDRLRQNASEPPEAVPPGRSSD